MIPSNQHSKDPTNEYPQPPFPAQKQNFPGIESEMNPKADHGVNSYKGSNRLKDKVAIITGGDSGIGKAVAIAFAREGADVVISYLNDKEDVDATDTAHWVEQAGRKAVLIKGDITNEEHCIAIIERTIREFGKIDVLINNAAFQMARKNIQEISSEEWRHTFAVNIHAMFYLCKAADPYLKPGSSIINTTSVNAYHPSDDLLPYAATKSAIQNFTANLSQIYLKAERGIRVNAVAPGPVWTPLIPSTKWEDASLFGENTPIGRPGQPVEIAPAFVFLAADESSYISGATIPATGGRIAF